MPDCNLRVDHGICGRQRDKAVRIVSLRDTIELKTSSLCLIVLIAHAIVLFVPIEDAITERLRVDLTIAFLYLVMPLSLILKRFQLFDCVPIASSLAIDVPV